MYYKIYPTIARFYKLQGAKKDLFFLINSYRENKQPFYASVQHIADVININRRNVYPLLKKLIEEKLIEKIDNGINYTYQMCDETSQKCDELSQIEMKHLQESVMIHLKKCDETSQNGDETSQICDETSPNIKEYTNYNKVDIYKEPSDCEIQEFLSSSEWMFIYKTFEDVYGFKLCRFKNKNYYNVVHSWVINDPKFKQAFPDVLKFYKEGYKWDDGRRPQFNWLLSDSNNYFIVRETLSRLKNGRSN
jgi:predicted transcriptional regulator